MYSFFEDGLSLPIAIKSLDLRVIDPDVSLSSSMPNKLTPDLSSTNKGVNSAIRVEITTSSDGSFSGKLFYPLETTVLDEITIDVTKGGGSWAKTSGILRDAVKGKGNYGLGSGTFDEAMQAGRSWVGEGFIISKDGSSWISSNGLRQFRPQSFKPRLNIEQANFQWRNVNKGAWQSNGHLDIIKP